MTPKLVVLSNAKPDRDEEFNAWYDDVHAVDVLTRLEGYHEVRRYRLADAGQDGAPWQYMAVWDTTGERLGDTIRSTRELHARQASGQVDPADTLYRPNPAIAGYARSWWVPRTHIDGPRSPAADDVVLAIFQGTPDDDATAPPRPTEPILDALGDLMVQGTTHELAPDQLDEPAYSALTLVRLPAEAAVPARDALSSAGADGFGWWFTPISRPLVLEPGGQLTRTG